MADVDERSFPEKIPITVNREALALLALKREYIPFLVRAAGKLLVEHR
jgi:hypothetical protein